MVEKKISCRKVLAGLDVPAVVAFGNPLLDFLVAIEDEDILKKYNLTSDKQMKLRPEKLQALLLDIPSEWEQKTSAAGSAQNIMRILQWLCDDTFESQYSIYCGCIGYDAEGNVVEDVIRSAGVDTRLAVHRTLPTGTCVSLICKSSCRYFTDIGAAGVYTLEDLKNSDIPLDTIKIIYIEGFFVTHSLDVARELVRQAEEKNIIIAFNLNSTSILKDHRAAVCEMVGHAKIVFGNAREMVALAQVLKIKYDEVTDIPFLLNSLKRITISVSNTISGDWLRNGGIFVMSQGESGPAITVWGKGQSVQVQPIPAKGPVVDTTGVGDSLVAGFLTGILAECDPKRCLEWGCKVASMMVTRLGVTLPKNVPPDLLQ